MAKRFKRVVKQSDLLTRTVEVWVDEETGVEYLFVEGMNNYGGGLCPLLDRDGKPLIER